ncbi:hypothetical protein GCM10011513_24110 [Franconibacter daqui]|nr:hypothetical protein GCM10011513_24110 [Franconibacter daqui]
MTAKTVNTLDKNTPNLFLIINPHDIDITIRLTYEAPKDVYALA